MFKKILIANRGEIAVRIMRACKEMGIRPVAVFSDADRAALHVLHAAEAYPIGPAASRESYLSTEKIISVARASGCDTIHPGYGFLAENPAFARACADSGIVFIGPSPQAMEKLGSKTAARHLAQKAGVPTVPGTLDPLESAQAALEAARKIGFPVVLKAVAGGGGKGMRLVQREDDLAASWRDASLEAKNAFGDGRLYLEKYLSRPRHVEIQVVADHGGKVICLGERECSVQRRHQKVIEEAPSPMMTPELRQAMCEAAVNLVRAGGYVNAGTVEFLFDSCRSFYFLEMNTRLQVEHPVTEMVTSVDIVKLQIQIASGAPIPFAQDDVKINGHAIECRIYAEDPDNEFFPSPGRIAGYRLPSGPGIRIDDGVYAGWTVPNEYDPLLGKLIAWGSNRAEAIARLRAALSEYRATGIKTNLGLFHRILRTREFQAGDFYTRWLDDFLRAPRDLEGSDSEAGASEEEDAAILAAALWHASRSGMDKETARRAAETRNSAWKDQGRLDQVNRVPKH
jgi:acetyl-CoA carboxylase biotin carboxylase subunit